jgi:hypothetical protein
MSNIQKILVLTNEDLNEKHKDKTLEEICITDFNCSIKEFQTEPFVIFIDKVNMGTKLLKNRYGKDGIVK